MQYLPPRAPRVRFTLLLFIAAVSVAVAAGWGVRPGLAAELTLAPTPSSPVVGGNLELVLWFDAEDQAVNAVEGTLRFNGSRLSAPHIRDGGSLLTLWVDHPTARGDQISFAGAIPGAYRGRGRLFSVVFTVRQPGALEFTWHQAGAYLHDGAGTAADVTAVPLTLVARPAPSPAPPGPYVSPFVDTTPPEPFTPFLMQDAAVADGRWVAVFATQDKGIGLDHYQVAETSYDPTTTTTPPSWRVATSPYVLADQTLHSYIAVQAVDREGNVRLGLIRPVPAVPPQYRESSSRWIFISVSVLLLVVVWALGRRWRRPQQ